MSVKHCAETTLLFYRRTFGLSTATLEEIYQKSNLRMW